MKNINKIQKYVDNDLMIFREEIFEDMIGFNYEGLDSKGEPIYEKRFKLKSLDFFKGKRLSGLIGGSNPSNYSKSPYLWNSFFRKTGINSIYVCFDFNPKKRGEFGKFLKELLNYGILDISITDPFKKEAFEFLTSLNKRVELSETAIALGVVNHIIYDKEKDIIYGIMTDGEGMVWAIENLVQIKGKKIFLIGAGGAGSAIGFEFARKGVNSIGILNRTSKRVGDLINKIVYSLRKFPKLEILDFNNYTDYVREADILIYAIEPDINLEGLEKTKRKSIFADVRYGKKEKFAKLGEKLGKKSIDGRSMLFGQFVIAAKKVGDIENCLIEKVNYSLNSLEREFL